MGERLKDKVAIVTGGCRGIGLAIVKVFLSEGAIVFAWDYQIPSESEVFISDPALSSRVFTLQVDVSSAESVENATKYTLDKTGRIDILVNNAGITRDNLLIRMSENDWDSVLTTNLKGVFLCTKSIVRSMMSQRSGRIINISSVVGIMGNAGQSNYSASKAGLIGFTKSIAKEFAGRNILANCIAPGYVRTPMTDKLSEDQKQQFLQIIPLRRPAEPEDIARVALFLASEDASYITGQVINVDGGMVM